jgi:hypothetical protein
LEGLELLQLIENYGESLSPPTKAHGSNQWLWLVCGRSVALLTAEFHGIQDLLEAGMLADVGQQRIDTQPMGAVVVLCAQ